MIFIFIKSTNSISFLLSCNKAYNIGTFGGLHTWYTNEIFNPVINNIT